jgi:adenylylsulfate kinase
MAGLPGTGKTTLARELAARTSGRVVSKDEIRHAIFAPEEVEYSSRQDDFCMTIMLHTAAYLFERQRERSVFLDGRTFSRRYQIDNVIMAAAAMHQPWRILECICSDQSAKQRLEQQQTSGEHPAGNRNYELYLRVKARFETITLLKTVIDTDEPLTVCCDRALAALR